MTKGHITICKIYSDGTQEVVLDWNNQITAGLGSSFIDILATASKVHADDYDPAYFQVGTGTIGGDSLTTSAYFYRLSAPFSWEDYGYETNLNIQQRYRCFNASTDDGGISYSEMLQASAAFSSVVYSGVDEYFAHTIDGWRTKYYMDSFSTQLLLDKDTGNGKDITELGLFIKNPRGIKEDSPFLIAYKKFDAISKNSSFALLINWSIGFLGMSKVKDSVFTGGSERGPSPLGETVLTEDAEGGDSRRSGGGY